MIPSGLLRGQLPAGIRHMNMALFLALTTVGSLLWTALLAGLGHVLGSRFEQVFEFLDPRSWIVVGLIVAGYVWRVATYLGGRADAG